RDPAAAFHQVSLHVACERNGAAKAKRSKTQEVEKEIAQGKRRQRGAVYRQWMRLQFFGHVFCYCLLPLPNSSRAALKPVASLSAGPLPHWWRKITSGLELVM